MMKQTIDPAAFSAQGCALLQNEAGRTVLQTEPGKAGLMLKGTPMSLGGADWTDARYIAFDVMVKERWSIGVTVSFWEAGNDSEEQNLIFIQGLLPGVRTRVSIPLAALDSQKMFFPRKPGQLKMVIHGNRVDLAKVDRIRIGVQKSSFRQQLELSDIHITDTEPVIPLPDMKLVDPLGQWALRDWPGKMRSEEELIEYLQDERAKPAPADLSDFSDEWSAYGGWKGKRFEATGYFRTHHDGSRWWLVDPEGCAFYSNGLDVVRPNEDSPIEGIESLFEWLPPEEGAYADAYSVNSWFEPTKNINFSAVNLIRTFGESWWEDWAAITRRRMIEWGFNTIGNWSDERFIREAKLPYVWPLDRFPGTKKTIFRDFPDVFSAEYQENANAFAEELRAFEGDRYMIGYFLRNEPEWAFINGLVIAEELLANEGEFVSKDELIAFLADRYGNDIKRLNAAWGICLADFDDLRKPVAKASRLSEASREDLRIFSRRMIELYVKIPSEACKKVDPVHLNLGMRYAYLSDEDLLAGCEHFDVFSINCYKLNPEIEIDKIAKATGLPVMIGEYHFGALDRGLPTTGLRGVTTQDERGKAYRYYTEHAANHPNSVGAHYFILADQSALGRADGENYQIGIVTVCHKPYEEFVRHAKSTHETIYAVAAGGKPVTEEQPDEIEYIAF